MDEPSHRTTKDNAVRLRPNDDIELGKNGGKGSTKYSVQPIDSMVNNRIIFSKLPPELPLLNECDAIVQKRDLAIVTAPISCRVINK